MEINELRDYPTDRGYLILFDKEDLESSLNEDTEQVLIRYLDGEIKVEDAREGW